MADDEVFWSPQVLADYDETCTFIPAASGTTRKKKVKQASKSNTLHSYWTKRYDYFSRYDDGVLIDHTGWYSVTPEHTAAEIAMLVESGSLVYDGFAGIGGNAIQFALHGSHVIASELDELRASMCLHNTRVYGVNEFVDVVCGDYYTLSDTLQADVVFLSPPWGGPTVNHQSVFRLDTINGQSIFKAAQRVSPNIIYYLPRHTSITDLAGLAPEECFRVIIHRDHCKGKMVAVSALFGPMFVRDCE